MHRFFLPEECVVEDRAVIPGRLVHRLRNVLRLGEGDHVVVLDNTGWEYEVELGAAGGGQIEGRILGRWPSAGEPRTRITLHQALLKGSAFEVVLQKCTEIGVTAFVPVLTERCIAEAPASGKTARWQRVILEAAQQSRRGRLPYLHPATTFRDACRSAEGMCLLPWEGEEGRGIRAALGGLAGSGSPSQVSIFIGPEGGFSAGEVELARGSGVVPVSFGKRIVRAETAGLVAAAVTLYECDDLGPGS
jgi:16S rRNA (uracil1498-N3)-methyltransferase